MGLWDIIRKMPIEPQTTVPDARRWDPDYRPLTVGDTVDTITGAVKFARNAGRRIKSLFDGDEEKELKRGDVIGICRGFFDHYGVYIDDGSVIHYSSKDSDTSSENSIIETSLDMFMRGDDTLFRLDFPAAYGKPGKIVTNRQGLVADERRLERAFRELLEKMKNYRLYSADETIERAKSRLGENEYNLRFNNCEHFAIWCKTGISESHQVNEIIEAIRDSIRT